MPRQARQVILVVGVGRSGTSLAMQALVRLGVGVSQDLVPASENNPRGAFEDLAVRDRMTALGRKFSHFRGEPRPDDWRDDPLSQETEVWLAEHLDGLAGECEQPALAVKFPLASVYLPIWYDAAARIELPLSVVWATRNSRDTIASLIRAYDFEPRMARIRYLQRLSSLMEDLRPDALLLPYEGWADDPGTQIRTLADFAGLPLEDEAAALDDLFDPSINHGGEAAPSVELDPLSRRVDEMITGRLGRVGERIPSDPQPLRTLSHHITTVLAATSESRNHLKRAEAADEALAQTEAELEAARARADAAEKSLGEARDALAAKDARLAEVLAACDALARARDADQAARDDRAAALEAELLRLRVRSEKLKTAEALARKNASELEHLRASRRWRIGARLSRLYHKPRWRDLRLPFRFLRSLRVRSR
jgi:hypothetical protein